MDDAGLALGVAVRGVDAVGCRWCAADGRLGGGNPFAGGFSNGVLMTASMLGCRRGSEGVCRRATALPGGFDGTGLAAVDTDGVCVPAGGD